MFLTQYISNAVDLDHDSIGMLVNSSLNLNSIPVGHSSKIVNLSHCSKQQYEQDFQDICHYWKLMLKKCKFEEIMHR